MKAYLESIFNYFPIFSDVSAGYFVALPVVTVIFIAIMAIASSACVSRKGFEPVDVWVYLCTAFWPWLIVLELYPSAKKEKTLPTVIEQLGLALAIISILGGIVFLFNRYL
ncbi:hypothetical protein [Oecophyllibacter saccharovorans]|uniref:Uncharacterized protein n=1 Tax=Oecophyllibacter saccharovorans TaxID=2558360 RepID=A0A506UM33_9PROT|nr:hypothetical protein [Oecophyllibacter saccharovorans]TPW34401.1 hypothetical protein E3202_07910 [Oecophyllibacter saccharovorans]